MDEQSTSFQHSMNVQFGGRKRGPGFGLWFGIVLVIVGGGLLLDAFGILEFGELLHHWWPSLLMIIALAQLATGSGSLLGSGILFTIGALLQLGKLDYLPGGFWSGFWPIVLILVGISIISSRFKKKERIRNDPNSLGRISVDGSRVNRTAFFSGSDMRATSSDFTGGELTAVFGGIECDMRESAMLGKMATLHIVAVCGGIELRVPESWNIVITGTPIFGGIDDKGVRKPHDPNAPTLLIETTVFFGGLEVRS